MATKEIKQKIVLEGEREYKQALHDANRNLKTLRSELKAETSELGKNATEQEKNRKKAESLGKQIAEQEKIVATYRAELEEVRKKYGDNADAMAAYEQKLNNARATLGGMRSELESIGTGMGNVSAKSAEAVVATKSFADSLEKIAGVGEAVSGAIEGFFSATVAHLKDAVTEVWGMISETAARADEWSDLAGFWGSDAQTIQSYARAVGSVNDSFSDLNSLVSRIVMGGKGKDIAALVGISGVNYDGSEWDYAMAVITRLREMQDEGKNLTPIYEQLFGEKKSQKAMDLVNDWDLIQAKLASFNGDESGFGMTSEGLATMQQVQLMITDIQQKWDALQDRFAEGLGKTTLEIGTSVTGAMEGLADFFAAGDKSEREAALQKIRENVEEACRRIGEAIREGLKVLAQVGQELQGSEDPVTRAIGDILTSLTESLQWMIEHQEEVKAAFEAIFGVWLVGKLAAVAGQLAGIVAQIKVIQGFKGLSLAGSAAAGAAGASGGGAGVSAFLAGMGAAGKKALEFLGGTGGKVLGGAGAFLTTLLTPAATDGDYYDEEGVLRDKQGHALASTNVGSEIALDQSVLAERKMPLTGAQKEALEAFWDAWRQDDIEMTPTTNDKFIEAWDAYEAAFAGQEHLFDKVDELLTEFQSGAAKSGEWPYMEDLPADFWQRAGGEAGSSGISGADLQAFQGVPAAMAAAVAAGAAQGVSGIRVALDGEAVGRLVAPYVSESVARDVILLN